MLRTLIVEDELYIRKGLISMIQNSGKNIAILGECDTINDAIAVAKACKPNLIFLDINLPDGTAFDFLDKTNSLDYNVIFITAYEQYAIQALKNGAIDYILKPVDTEELNLAIDRAMNLSYRTENEQFEVVKKQLIENKKEKIVLRLQEGYQIIDFKLLTYCKSDKGYTTFYLSNGKSYLTSKPLKEYEGRLPLKNFFRTHQSYIVNLDYIDNYDKSGYIFLKSGEKIPVSTRKKEAFVTKLLNG